MSISISNTLLSNNVLFNRNKENKKNSIGSRDSENGVIQQLIKEKERIQEDKREFLKKSMENNVDSVTIKQRTEEYDRQIREIDKQISDLKVKEQNEHLNSSKSEKDKKEENTDKNKDSNSMEGVLSLSDRAKYIELTQKVKNSMNNEKRVLKAEIKQDNSRGIFSKLKSDRLEKINENIEDIDKKAAEKNDYKHKRNFSNLISYLKSENYEYNKAHIEKYS